LLKLVNFLYSLINFLIKYLCLGYFDYLKRSNRIYYKQKTKSQTLNTQCKSKESPKEKVKKMAKSKIMGKKLILKI
jgi:hypothetical protein